MAGQTINRPITSVLYLGLHRNYSNSAPERCFRMEAQQSLIADVENAIACGSSDQRVNTLRRITDLFVSSSDSYSAEQVDVFDDVITRLAEEIETKARAELANRLAPVTNAPVATVRKLARDPSIAVAGPVLSQSKSLTEADLLSFADGQDQARLLAISKRAAISEKVGDMLATKGDQDVVRSVARNAGARFSDAGFGKLVERSISDDELAVSVGLRADVPKEHFHALVSKASEAVFKKLAASNPAAVGEVNRVLYDLTGHQGGTQEKVVRNYVQAKAAFEELQRSGKSIEATVQLYARKGKFEEVIVVISRLCQLPIDAVERILADKRVDNDLALLVIKAADMTWPTAKLILDMRFGADGMTAQASMTARQHFERLQVATAKRVVRFYQARHAANREPPK